MTELEENLVETTENENFEVNKNFFEKKNTSNKKVLDALTKTLKVKDFKYVIRSDVDKLAQPTLRSIKAKFSQLITNLPLVLAENLAPNQGNKLLQLLFDDDADVDDDENNVPIQLRSILKQFNECNTKRAKTIILSTVPLTFTKKEVAKWFKVSNYKVAKARKLLKTGNYDGLESKKLFRDKLDSDLLIHFLQWCFSSGALQEQSWGVTTVK